MASTKRPTLAESGIDKLFQSSHPPVPSRPATAPVTPATPTGTWEATHRRRTFYCDNAVWDRLTAWGKDHGISHSAAITQALEAFLNDRGR